jgi:hypothetical protein
MFSDESKFVLTGNGEGVRVWRRALEHFMSNTVHEPVPFGGGSIMVWWNNKKHSQGPCFSSQR